MKPKVEKRENSSFISAKFCLPSQREKKWMVANNSCCVVNTRIKRQNEQKRKEGKRHFFYCLESKARWWHTPCVFDKKTLWLHMDATASVCVCFALHGVSIKSVCVEQCVLCLRAGLVFELWQTLSNNCRVHSYNKKHEHTGSIGDKSPNMNARCYSISIRTQRQKTITIYKQQ